MLVTNEINCWRLIISQQEILTAQPPFVWVLIYIFVYFNTLLYLLLYWFQNQCCTMFGVLCFLIVLQSREPLFYIHWNIKNWKSLTYSMRLNFCGSTIIFCVNYFSLHYVSIVTKTKLNKQLFWSNRGR